MYVFSYRLKLMMTMREQILVLRYILIEHYCTVRQAGRQSWKPQIKQHELLLLLSSLSSFVCFCRKLFGSESEMMMMVMIRRYSSCPPHHHRRSTLCALILYIVLYHENLFILEERSYFKMCSSSIWCNVAVLYRNEENEGKTFTLCGVIIRYFA